MKRIEMTIRSVMPYFERFDLQPLLPKVIIIDEPELGLHPIAITKLSGLIKSAAERDVKLLFQPSQST